MRHTKTRAGATSLALLSSARDLLSRYRDKTLSPVEYFDWLEKHIAAWEPALRALERIDASESVTIHFPTSDDHAAARRWIERMAPRPVTYTDAVSFAVMEALACRHVIGFDQDFPAAGFTLWNGV